MRNKLSLPIQRNAIIALFLLKKLQPFFAPQAKTFKEIGTAISQLSTPKNYDLFEDFDEKLEAKSQILGEQSALTPGDFKCVYQKYVFMKKNSFSHQHLITALRFEVESKHGNSGKKWVSETSYRNNNIDN